MYKICNVIKVVEEFITYIELIKKRSNHTVVSYRTDLLVFITYCNDVYETSNLNDINHLIIRSWIASMKKEEYSNSSINRKISTLKSFYKFCKRKDLIESNPMLKIQTLKASKRLPSFIPETKMQYLIESNLNENSFSLLRDQLVITCLLYTSPSPRD